jgi:hypothetical protein
MSLCYHCNWLYGFCIGTLLLLLLLYDIFLTAIGLTPSGSSTVHIYTKYTEKRNESEYSERNIRNNKNILEIL